MHDLIKKIHQFVEERNWDQFHTGANLAKSIAIETGELLELFQWNDNVKNIDSLKDELADILIYSILLAEKYNLNIEGIIQEKIIKNEKKYPVSKSYGKSTKYSDF